MAVAVANAGHILLVDDDPDLRRSLAEVLEDEGFEVSCATNGEEALDALAGDAPNAILLDLTMPIMDGWTFRERQRHDPRLAHIPTVVISAAYFDARAVEGLEADAFLAKPFEIARLTETLQRLCRDARAAPGGQPARGVKAAARAVRAAAPRSRR
ncbi:MAG TPA: response regulator [Anaeromyxobacter sp.]